jgi:hypothetical protein
MTLEKNLQRTEAAILKHEEILKVKPSAALEINLAGLRKHRTQLIERLKNDR